MGAVVAGGTDGVGSQDDGCALCSSFPPRDQLAATESRPARWTAGPLRNPHSAWPRSRWAPLPLRAPVPLSAAPAARPCHWLPPWTCLWVRVPGQCPRAGASVGPHQRQSLLRVHGSARTRAQGRAPLRSTVRCAGDSHRPSLTQRAPQGVPGEAAPTAQVLWAPLCCGPVLRFLG